jgi:hypothetical protein
MERAMRVLVASTLAFGLCAGCAHRSTTVRRTETIRQEPQDTYVAPPVVEHQETVIKRSHTHTEEDD